MKILTQTSAVPDIIENDQAIGNYIMLTKHTYFREINVSAKEMFK